MENRKYTQGEVRGINKQTRTVTFQISDGTKDRHGTVLNPNNWKLDNYRKNPIVGYSHEVYGTLSKTDPDSIIGKARVYQEGNELLADVTFEPKEINEQADKIFSKVLFGSIRAASVGFVPLQDEQGSTGSWGKGEEAQNGKRATWYYHGQELIEISVVNIPSNVNAVIKKSSPEVKQSILANVLEAVTDQGIEDLLTLTVKGLLSIIQMNVKDRIKNREQVEEFDLMGSTVDRIRQDVQKKIEDKERQVKAGRL